LRAPCSASDGNTAPLFLSAPLAVFTVGVAGTFTVRAAGDPVLSAGALSPGLEFTDYGGGMAVIEGTPAPTTDQGGGTAVLSGTPSADAASGIYTLTLTASNAAGTVSESFELTII